MVLVVDVFYVGVWWWRGDEDSIVGVVGRWK